MAIQKNAPRVVHCGVCGADVTIKSCTCKQLTAEELVKRNNQRVDNFRASVKQGLST